MKEFFAAVCEIWKDVRDPMAYGFKTIFSEIALAIWKFITVIFRLFWMDDETAVGILRTERVTKYQIVTGAFGWFVFLLINLLTFVSARHNANITLTGVGFLLTIVSADIFLYWIKLGFTYNLKHDVVNPDREI